MSKYSDDKRQEEINLMNKVEAFIGEDSTYIFEDSEFSVNDGYFIKGDKKYITEIKVRPNYTEESIIAFGGMVLEKSKLTNCAKKYNDKLQEELLYVVQFQDKVVGYLISFYALNEDSNENWITKGYKKTSHFSDNSKVEKQVLHLQGKHKIFEFNI